jgi:CubicO group peptidase (beta-lactamase class C family)
MRFLTSIVAAAWLLAGGALAAPSATDLAAITAVESRITPIGSTEGKTLAARMAELKVPGVSVAFIEDGKVKWTRTYGVADASDGRLVRPDTLFQAASMSKAVAAAGALRLVEQGRLDLDGDVNARLKTWQVPASPHTAAEKVTLRRLLSHTAGLTVSGFPGYAAGKPIPSDVQMLDGKPPANTPAVRSFEPPGQGYAYSGGGYTVAQLLMTEAGGQPFPKLLDRLILRPAGMRSSTFVQPLPQAVVQKAASAHDPKGAVIQGARHTYPEYAAAGLWTTPSDYGRFLIALQRAYSGEPRAILDRASARAMLTPVLSSYGLGMIIEPRGQRLAIQHSGGNEGFQCHSFAFLDGSRQGVVIMTNGSGGWRLAREVLAATGSAYGWPPAEKSPEGSNRRAPLVAATAP